MDQNSKLFQQEEEICFPSSVEQSDCCVIPKQFVSKLVNEGSKIKVHVADVRNPSQFWVILKSGLLDVADLMYYIQEVYFDENQSQKLLIPEKDVTPGMFCVALYEGEYNRCLVKKINIEMHQVEVLFIDYGTVSLIDSKQLYKLLDKFSFLPQQAIKAKLAGVQPFETTWSPEAIERFSAMVAEFKELTATVERIDRNNKILRLKLMDDQNDKNINDTLVENQLALDENLSWISSELSFDFAKPSEFLEKQFVPNGTKEQDEMEFCVGEIVHPGKFWLISKDGFEDLVILLNNMHYTYSEKSTTMKIPESELRRGMYCVAVCEGEYDRAVIKNVMIKDHQVEVFFVDYGTVLLVDSRELLYLLKEFMYLPAQAVEARLTGIQSLETEWPSGVKETFSSMVSEYKILTVKISGIDWYKRVLEVNLMDKSSGVCINTALMKNNLAIDESSEDPPLEMIKVDDDLLHQFELSKIQEKAEVVVYVSEIISPSEFWVILTDRYEDLQELKREMQATYAKRSEITKIPETQLKEGMLCVALNGSKYSRACINKIRMESRQADIFFFDCGKFFSVDLTELHFLYDRFAGVPRQAVKATLTGIVSFESETRWPSEAIRRFSEMVEEKPLLAKISSWDGEKKILKVLLIDTSDANNRKSINDVLVEEEWASIGF